MNKNIFAEEINYKIEITMKKIILIVALVVAYGVSMSNAATKIVDTEKAEVTLVANDVSPDGEEKATVDEKKDCSKDCSKACCSKEAKAECSKTAKKGCSSACSKTAAKSSCTKEKQQASK